ncbi:acyl-CoA dehydrogenase family protein [Thermodesulfobacteriota bacterium]
MDFELSPEHKSLQDTVRKFMDNDVRPIVEKPENEKEFHLDVWKKMGEMGLLGLDIPAEYGGSEADAIMLALAITEISKVSTSLACSVAPHNCFAGSAISLGGSEEMKNKYLPRLASGELIGAGGWTEPGAGSDVHGIKTNAVKEGDYYVVNGSKTLITNAPICDVFVTIVVTDKSTKRPGLTCLVVDKESPGVSFGKPLDKMGLLGSPTGEIFFEDCRVPVENRIGEENMGFSQLMEVFEKGRIAMSCQCLGTAVACFEAAVKYAKSRSAFGNPIANFQAIKFMIADMKKNIDAARLLIMRAAWLKDQGKSIEMEASIAKLFTSEISVKCALDAVQIHGGYGYMKEYMVERYMRDVMLNPIGEGTSEIQRLIIARHVLKKFE